jgi:hypothetical protein
MYAQMDQTHLRRLLMPKCLWIGSKINWDFRGIKPGVEEVYSFRPPRRNGILFHLASILVLLLASGIGLYRIAYVDVGPAFALYLAPVVLSIPLVPFMIYRLSLLMNAVYELGRDQVRLQWGLRVEVIPINTILWVQPASQLTEKIRYPWLRWPGSVFGARRMDAGNSLEYMASTTRDMILIATYEKVFGISPADPGEFLNVYQRLTELGSLFPPQHESVHPTFLLVRVWKTAWARTLILVGILLSLALVIWVSMAVPTRSQISLGFLPSGEPRDAIPAVRLMLLPVLNAIFWMFDFIVGLFLFRREDQRPLAYLLWLTSALASGLFLVAVFSILRLG